MWTDPYAVLQVAHGSSESEIKQAYKRALLLYHPDKINSKTTNPSLTIDDINAAFRQIKTVPETQETSDGPLLFNETVDLSEFDESELPDGSMQWVRNCRCGDSGYVLQEQELVLNGDADEIAVQCAGCSLWILVQYASE